MRVPHLLEIGQSNSSAKQTDAGPRLQRSERGRIP